MLLGTWDVIVPTVSSVGKPCAVTFLSTSASSPDPWCLCSTTTLSTRTVSGPGRKSHCKFVTGVSTMQQLMGVIRQLTSWLSQSQLHNPPNHFEELHCWQLLFLHPFFFTSFVIGRHVGRTMLLGHSAAVRIREWMNDEQECSSCWLLHLL